MRYLSNVMRSSIAFLMAVILLSCGGSESGNGGKGESKGTNKDTNVTRSKKKEEARNISPAKFANAVRKRILEKAREQGGHLKIPDPRDREDTLLVKLIKVVEKSVGKTSKNVRYVCGKFKGVENGKHYNIDFFMEGNEPSSLEPAREPILHKVNGKARYKYVKKKNGLKEPKKIEEKKGKDKKSK